MNWFLIVGAALFGVAVVVALVEQLGLRRRSSVTPAIAGTAASQTIDIGFDSDFDGTGAGTEPLTDTGRGSADGQRILEPLSSAGAGSRRDWIDTAPMVGTRRRHREAVRARAAQREETPMRG